MSHHSPVLKGLAQLFARSWAARTGAGTIDFQPELSAVLRAADCEDGDERAQALHDLAEAERSGLLRLERHPRDPDIIVKVRVPLACESALFARVGEASPAQRRNRLAATFAAAAQAEVPGPWRAGWAAFCARLTSAASSGESVAPFDREDLATNDELLALLPKLLAWKGESLVRFASCVLCGDSKRLEGLAAVEKDGALRGRLRGKLGRLLDEITGGAVRSLDDLGIVANPRFALVHGPLRLLLDGQWLDLGRLHGAFRLAKSDVERAAEVATTATRCITIENETSFHELAKLQSGELLIQTSYPGSGTLALLRRLPATMQFWHFGDSDVAGFDILRVIGEHSGREIRPLHMERGRVPFEQESLGRPRHGTWPFYD
ncbi:MAG TPA: Wadjet anti-phage system protein JetD domain-containing protein [Tepidisphaeraceae bacterium]|nr:Wadjet anti-phage system protein JetD domain-containing protein [Tepidisphaeraceae bacterium]